MRSSKPGFSLAAILIQSCLLTASPALADTYKVFTLDTDQDRFAYGMDASGSVVLSAQTGSSGQCTIGINCYETFIGGVLAFRTNAPPPAFTLDDGTPCSPAAPPGLTVLHAVCNNGREAFSAQAPGQSFPDLYTGPNIVDLFPGQGGADFLYLNSEGDILWNDSRTELWLEAFDLTSQTPEPGSLFLLATGTLAAAEAMRRRALVRHI
jgi:PEP-CTERM motif